MTDLRWDDFKKLSKCRRILIILGQMVDPTRDFIDTAGKLKHSPQDVFEAIFPKGEIKLAQTETLINLLRRSGLLRSNGKRGLGAEWKLMIPQGLLDPPAEEIAMLGRLVNQRMTAARESDESDGAAARVHRATAAALAGLASIDEVRQLAAELNAISEYL